MNDHVFEARISETRQQIKALPVQQRDAVMAVLEDTLRRHAQIQHHVDRLRDLLADWRVRIKYLRFDLEATRRELAELRRQQREG